MWKVNSRNGCENTTSTIVCEAWNGLNMLNDYIRCRYISVSFIHHIAGYSLMKNGLKLNSREETKKYRKRTEGRKGVNSDEERSLDETVWRWMMRTCRRVTNSSLSVRARASAKKLFSGFSFRCDRIVCVCEWVWHDIVMAGARLLPSQVTAPFPLWNIKFFCLKLWCKQFVFFPSLLRQKLHFVPEFLSVDVYYCLCVCVWLRIAEKSESRFVRKELELVFTIFLIYFSLKVTFEVFH